MTTLVQKAVKSDLHSKCDNSCPLFAHCNYFAEHDTLQYKIAKFCSDRYKNGYRNGYNQRKREEGKARLYK